jgi:LysM repeat protein
MELAKLNITPLDPSGEPSKDSVPVLFNPNSYSIVKPVTWRQPDPEPGRAPRTYRDLNAPPVVFGGGGARTLTLQLFFDVTEGGADGITTDVRKETNKIVALTRIARGRAEPPVCRVSWGQAPPGSDFPFDGVVTSLTQNFVLFRASGEPVRANLTVVFTEFIKPVQDKQETDPDLTTYLVKRGDTLSAISAKLYRDPTLWRTIAAANEIDDPRGLKPGVRLAIPNLT